MISSRQRILETGVTMFAQKGYGSTGMRELSDRAEVNLAMINYYFGSKKGLLREILDTFLSGYYEIASAELRREGSIDEKIHRLLKRIVPYIRSRKDYFIVVLTELPHDDSDIIEYKTAWIRKIIDLMQTEICEPLSSECKKEITPYAIGPIMIGMVAMRFLVDPIFELVKPVNLPKDFEETYPDLVAEIFLNGINGLQQSYKDSAP